MAAKKATASTSKAKKAVAKKSPVKPVKKVAAKKVAAKPAKPVKKAAVKKVAAKKVAAKPVKKSAVKKVAAKKVAAKPAKPVKKSAVKKAAATKPIENIVVPELPVGPARPARPDVSSVAAVPPIVIATPPTKAPAPVAKQGSSGRVLLAVIVGIVLLIAIVWSQSGTEDSDQALPESTQTSVATPTPSETMSEPTPTPEVTPEVTPEEEMPATEFVYEAPKNAVGNYTATGLRLTWRAPDASDGLTGYNIEISRSGGAFEMFSNLPASQLSLDLTKSGTNGWTTFRISSVYSDDQVASVKPFGFPGQYS